MIFLIAGASHTGKTNLAQKLLEKYHYNYLSIDHLKMGLIRSKETLLTPYDDKELEIYLWNILKEIIKTAIENEQNLIVEGCYIPFNWQESFSKKYLKNINYICLIMSENYIQNNLKNIFKYENIIEKRIASDLNINDFIEENIKNLQLCQQYGLNYIFIDNDYDISLDNFKKFLEVK